MPFFRRPRSRPPLGLLQLAPELRHQHVAETAAHDLQHGSGGWKLCCFVVSRERACLGPSAQGPGSKLAMESMERPGFLGMGGAIAGRTEEGSGGWKCAIVGVPLRGSVSACLAWGDLFVNDMFKKVLKRLNLLRHRRTPVMAHLQLPEWLSLSLGSARSPFRAATTDGRRCRNPSPCCGSWDAGHPPDGEMHSV